MARLTKVEAARQLGIARSTLYRLIAQGQVSPTPEGFIDSAELVRVAPYVDTLTGQTRTRRDRHETSAFRQAETLYERPQTVTYVQTETDTRGHPETVRDTLVDILRDQIQILREQLTAALAREQHREEEIAWLRHQFEQMQHRYDRLLEAPRAVLPPAGPREPSPSLPRGARRAPREDAPYDAAEARMLPVPEPVPPPAAASSHRRGRPGSPLRQRILALLQAHPEGLRAEEIRVYLKVEKPIGDLLQGMRKGGVVTTRGHRPDLRYVYEAGAG